MDAELETDQELRKQQQQFAAKLQAEAARMQAEEEPFADIEWRYNQASGALLSAMRTGGIGPEEQEVFNQLQEQYESAKAKQEELGKSGAGTNLGDERQRVASLPIFVQQDETYHDEEYGAANVSTGSKRKRAEAPKDLTKPSKPDGMTETIKQSLKRLIADAPADKKQAAIRDSARVLHAIKQFPAGSVEYFEEGTWLVEGVITPIKTHQLISAGWMIERETSAGGPKGGILADMMGLGKTLSSLTSMIYGQLSVGPRGSKANLVVVPKSLKDQWYSEARKKTVEPTSEAGLGLRHIITYSPEASSEAQMLAFKGADLVIATYTELSSAFRGIRYPSDMSDASDAEKEEYFEKNIRSTLPAIFRFKFRAIYLDEGHLIRNVKTLCATTCQKLMSKYRWILTGTPMTNDPTDLYSVLTFISHPKVSEFTFKEFKAKYNGKKKKDKTHKNNKDVKKGRRGRNGKKLKNDKGEKNEKDEKKAIDFEWVGTLLHESMRSWKYEDELFGHPLTKIPDPIIKEMSRELSVPERVIYSIVWKRLRQLAEEKADEDDIDDDDDNTAKTQKFVAGLLTVLRQMTGHVLLIRPEIFKYLTEDDMTAIYKGIYNPETNKQSDPTETSTDQNPASSFEPGLDPHADDYIVALRELQRNTTCVVCQQRATDLRWAACNHAYCYKCLEHQMHLAAEKGLRSALCEVCKLPLDHFTNEAEDEKNQKSRWLNKNSRVIPSTKSSAVVELIRSWRDPLTGNSQAKVVVLTSFKESHKLLAAIFKEQQWKFTALTSEMSIAERNESVCRFINEADTFVMLATSGVGATGLNLMVAKYLINYDHYFNESTESQARGRVYRIGQQEETTIVSLTATGTIDERLKDIKQSKIENIDKVMDSSNKKTMKALLKMLEKAKKTNDIVELD
ncbi:P-loop containing nucleoside triphosphate hydrolase protein, partial [Aureobasidium melanogenum]